MENKFYDFNTGSIFIPSYIKRNLRQFTAEYFNNKYKNYKQRRVYDKIKRFEKGVYVVCYLQYLQKDKLMQSGEVMIPREVLFETVDNTKFVDDFVGVADLIKKKTVKGRKPLLSFRRTPQGKPHGFGVNYPTCTKMEKADPEEEAMCRKGVDCFYTYLKEHSTCTVSPEFQDFTNNYYKYEIDMEVADAVCRERNGVSFEEAVDYLQNARVGKLSDKMFIQCRDAEKEFFICNSFNHSKYAVKQVYGRVYTPFHNLAKEYRKAFRLRKTGEEVAEALDMKGAFVKGALVTTACYSYELGKKEVSDKIMKSLSTVTDPYAFAVKCGYDRDAVKPMVLSFLFSSMTDITRRNQVYNRVQRLGLEDAVKLYAEKFLAVVKANRNIYYLNNRDLNALLAPFSTDDCVFRAFYRANNVKKIRWTNGTAGKGFYSLRNFVKALNRTVSSIGQAHVVKCFVNAYGEDVLSALYENISMYDNYTKVTLDALQKSVQNVCKAKGGTPCSRKDLKRGNGFNISILCQLAEGSMMFTKVLPMLKEKTGCTKLITLHDAIFCPISYKDKVIEAIGANIDKEYYKSIFEVYQKESKVRESVNYWKMKRRLER